MRVVKIRVERSIFGKSLAEMREWIDRNRADPVHFESTSDGERHVLVTLHLPRAELAFAFRRDWAEAVTDNELPAAA